MPKLNLCLTVVVWLINKTRIIEAFSSKLSPSCYHSRSQFLSSNLGSLFTCLVAATFSSRSVEALEDSKKVMKEKNPRYLQYEVEMNYADSPGENPRSRGVFLRRFTGDSTPFKFPIRPVSLVKDWPKDPPFKEKDFSRIDENDDQAFYSIPRLVYHIDEAAVAALTQYYRKSISPGSSILDICSSWVSHYPLEFKENMRRISGTGMSALELKVNDQLTDFSPRNLNIDSKLPYDDETFDVVTCVVSIDYLIKPIEVLKEVHRVLKSGGKVIISQSNRCFDTKAINMWLAMNDRQHLELINAYFQYAGGFKPRKVFDITAEGERNEYFDPMFIVEAEKE